MVEQNAMGLELEVIRRVGEVAALNPVSKSVPRKKKVMGTRWAFRVKSDEYLKAAVNTV